MGATPDVLVQDVAPATQAPMEAVDAELRAAVAAAVTTESMRHEAVRLSVAPATGATAMSPLQVSMNRRW